MIDPKAFIAAIRKLSADNPQKVYSLPTEYDEDSGEDIELEHQYVVRDDNGELVGSCPLGIVLLELGVEAHKLNVSLVGFADLEKQLGLGLPSAVVSWAVKFQDEQDDFKPWGVAVELADAAVSPAELELVTR
ncbi:hypothetical protein HQO42_14750 [Rhodococcus fascians]|nr:hypothetical protein [Rhodococcus fascians]MBY4237714.1 hypothetical protein [Rhodococcus fascians]MBY4253917.1 hypothetical protein [Rhodococcus fascians]MBY4269212.1 hypothetical protein [Rhodococcus fascians]